MIRFGAIAAQEAESNTIGSTAAKISRVHGVVHSRAPSTKTSPAAAGRGKQRRSPTSTCQIPAGNRRTRPSRSVLARRVTASFNVPANLPVGSGFTFHHAYVVYDASGKFYMASNAVPLTLR